MGCYGLPSSSNLTLRSPDAAFDTVPSRSARAILALIPLLLATVLGPGLSAQVRPYDEVVPGSAETDEGLFDVHRVGDQLLFEIPDEVLQRDMIIMSRLHRVQQGQTNVGSNLAPNIVVRWERRDGRIFLRAVSHSNTADPEDNVSIAVQNQSFAPILRSFEIEARGFEHQRHRRDRPLSRG